VEEEEEEAGEQEEDKVEVVVVVKEGFCRGTVPLSSTRAAVLSS
jgi:hypothetical protein